MYISIKTIIDYNGKEIKKGKIINLDSCNNRDRNFYYNRIKDGDFIAVIKKNKKEKEFVKETTSFNSNKKKIKGEN